MKSIVAAILSAALVLQPSRAVAGERDVDACIEVFERGQIDQKKGYLLAAMGLYESCATARCPTVVRADCAARLDTVSRSLPSVTIVVRDASGTDLDVPIELDGRPVKLVRGRALDVDPGNHAVSYVLNGKTRRHDLIAHEGEKSRLFVFTDGPEAATTETPQGEAGPRETIHLIGPIVTGVVGLALITWGIASYMGYETNRQRLQSSARRARRQRRRQRR